MKNKKAAMEMSVGTIVTIVLLMTVLILGLILVRTIFTSSIDNIKGIDQGIKSEINKLFTSDSTKKVVVYPESRKIIIKKGTDDSGFGFAIRNLEETTNFGYSISANEISCGRDISWAEDLISLGRTGSNIQIIGGNIMKNPIFVRFSIPSDAPPCQIRYLIDTTKGGSSYEDSISLDLEIKPE